MKFDPNTTTIGELYDDPQAMAALKEFMPDADETQLDDFVRGMTWNAAASNIKQMRGVDTYNKVLEVLKSL